MLLPQQPVSAWAHAVTEAPAATTLGHSASRSALIVKRLTAASKVEMHVSVIEKNNLLFQF